MASRSKDATRYGTTPLAKQVQSHIDFVEREHAKWMRSIWGIHPETPGVDEDALSARDEVSEPGALSVAAPPPAAEKIPPPDDRPDAATGDEARKPADPPKAETVSTDVLQKFAELAPDGATVMKLAKIISDTGKNVNDRMVEASELNPELYLKKSPWWAKMFGVEPQAIRKTDYWRIDRKDVLEKQAELRRKQLEERTS
jgi:hypothetical protein